jgi:hypothetical protein
MVWHGKWQGFLKRQFDMFNIMTKGKMPPKIGEETLKWCVKTFGMGKNLNK